MKKNGLRLLRWGGTLLSSVLFLWLISRQDWRELGETVRQMDLWLLPLAAGLYFTAILFNTLRWFLLLRVQNVSVRYLTLLQIVLSGNFASNFLPSTVGGDTVRIAGIAQFTGWAIGLASVVVDRLLNVVAMATLLPFSWFTLHPLVGLSSGQAGMPLYGGVLPALRRRLASGLGKIRGALGLWGEQKVALFLGIGISWLARLSVFSGVWLLARGLGITVALWQVIGVGAFTYLLSLVPVSINSLGLREVTMTALYVQLGATLEQASALSVVTRAILMLETLPGALWVTRALQVAKHAVVPDVEV
ncbi:MAG: UPF0104 family protein [Anaerolineae bacterium]|nr:MAG: UPF0104 family protein [Anaerolineae bacterium]